MSVKHVAIAGAATISAAAIAIIGHVFDVEGGYVNHRDDPGGPTKYGITEVVARRHGYLGPMQDLPQELPFQIYYTDYIVKPGFVAVLERSPPVAEEVIDSGVNAGAARSAMWLQRSLNLFNDQGRAWPDIAVDGKIGQGTMTAYSAMEKKRGPKLTCELLIKAMDGYQAKHYIELGEGKAGKGNTQFESFQTGWFRTRIGNVPLQRCAP